MIVGYRRLSGPIGLSTEETGTRGMWWEKRIALLSLLERRGHEVKLLSRVTTATQSEGKSQNRGSCDLLMVEFGGVNPRFFSNDLQETYSIIQNHKGLVVFICDDPDLTFPWGSITNENWSRWRVWVNSPLAALPGTPAAASLRDFPFSSVVPMRRPGAGFTIPKLAYIGRPNGRARTIKALLAFRVPFRVYGREGEWEKAFPGLSVVQGPAQPQRGAFYAAHLGCLAVADQKHKRLAWRTGRAYHAIAAGCPALGEADHLGMKGVRVFSHPQEAKEIAQQWLEDEGTRHQAVVDQQASVRASFSIAERALEDAGL